MGFRLGQAVGWSGITEKWNTARDEGFTEDYREVQRHGVAVCMCIALLALPPQ